ncbi:MAG: T9SS type A sorting domain-containing protein [candidate division SR1 bacterium]|nr:T9SS type A sorting domain-containing protein [candidate division SR1 bacterium]
MALEMNNSQEVSKNTMNNKKEVQKYIAFNSEKFQKDFEKEEAKKNILTLYPNPVGPNGPLNIRFNPNSYKKYQNIINNVEEENIPGDNIPGGSAEVTVTVGEGENGTEVQSVQTEQTENISMNINAVEIFDITGKLVVQNNNEQSLSNNQEGKVTFNNLSDGIYIIRSKLSDGTDIVSKIMVSTKGSSNGAIPGPIDDGETNTYTVIVP